MKKQILLTAFLILSAFTTGCSNSSGLSPEVSYSGFDRAATVTITPHGNDAQGMIGTGLGAEWNQSHPDQAILLVSVINIHAAIIGAELNIDGQKIALIPTNTITTHSGYGAPMKTSVQGFTTNLSIIENITKSKNTWLRVHTAEGTMEDRVIEGTNDSKAYHALIRFMAAIKKAQHKRS